MMKFCADISPLDIEYSILDIQHLFCQTPTTLPACAEHGRQASWVNDIE